MYEHNTFKIILIFLTVAVYIVMIAFNAGAGSGLIKGIFLQTVGNISNKYITEFTPSGWTFMIWNVIFAWQFLWLGYVVAGICRRSELGWMYLKPDVFPVCFYFVWILNNVLNIGWLFLWDREFLIPALVFLGAIVLTNYIVLFISYRALYLNGDWFFQAAESGFMAYSHFCTQWNSCICNVDYNSLSLEFCCGLNIQWWHSQ
ncbi:unnamed protein product [Staurois parvus]|uniref:Tryptophan-rich sensory protein n=1 Tax=Staurois parvus TaxID=386267 RepID=A0ABN9AEV4_9NEOB|nr:unnamed protein product [Staurois parvus]